MDPGLAFGAPGEVGGVVPALGPQDVEVDVAVADMAEGADPAPGCEGGHGRRGLVQEARDLADRDRDVVLPGRPLGLLGGGLVLPQGPEGRSLGLAGGDDGLPRDPVGTGLGEEGLHQPSRTVGVRRSHLEQNPPGRGAGQGVALARDVAQGEVDPLAGHQLEGFKPGVGDPAGAGQEAEGRLRALHRHHGDGPAGGTREQLDAGGGDHAEGALRT